MKYFHVIWGLSLIQDIYDTEVLWTLLYPKYLWIIYKNIFPKALINLGASLIDSDWGIPIMSKWGCVSTNQTSTRHRAGFRPTCLYTLCTQSAAIKQIPSDPLIQSYDRTLWLQYRTDKYFRNSLSMLWWHICSQIYRSHTSIITLWLLHQQSPLYSSNIRPSQRVPEIREACTLVI